MDFQKLTSQLSKQSGPRRRLQNPAEIEERIVQLGTAKASLVAIWTIDDKGVLTYTCHRDKFPLDRMQSVAEEFSKDQFEEYIRALAREAVQQAQQASE